MKCLQKKHLKSSGTHLFRKKHHNGCGMSFHCQITAKGGGGVGGGVGGVGGVGEASPSNQ